MHCAPPLALLLALVSPAPAQESCAQFADGFGPPGVQGLPTLLRTVSVGGVDKLLVAGSIVSAGNQPVSGVAYWDGHVWTASSTVLDLTQGETLRDLAVFDDGSGPITYAAGRFATVDGGSHIGIWDGSSFFDVGGGIVEAGFPSYRINDLAVFDDGSGMALYACGLFPAIGGQTVQSIARWDGSNWSGVGPASTFGANADFRTMCVFDDGSGPALFVGGLWTSDGVNKWDGVTWSVLGAGLSSPSAGTPTVHSLVVHDDGSGPALFAAGSLTAAGGAAVGLARWDGTSWSAVGSPPASALTRALYSWGSTLVMDGAHFWDGFSWSAPAVPPAWGSTTQMTEYDDGTGAKLFVGGSFLFVGDEHVAGIASFDGVSYAPLGGGLGAPKRIDAMTVFDDGTGPKLAADYRHNTANSIIGDGISLFDGTTWTPLGGATSGGFIETLESYDDGTGPALFAGGDFNLIEGLPIASLARWNGSAWEQVGGALSGRVRGLERFDGGSGEVLGIAGLQLALNGVPVSNVLAWDGTSLSEVGSLSSFNNRVDDLVVFDDGTGPALYAGGSFVLVEGQPAGRVARWNGTLWEAVGMGMDDWVLELAVHDDGSGPALFAGGRFLQADGAPAARVARWNGSSWSALGAGLPDSVKTLEVLDVGFGPVLFAGGQVGGGASAYPFLHYWDGTDWVPHEAALAGRSVQALSAWDDPTTFGPDAHIGGGFLWANGTPSQNFAQLSIECPCEAPTYCTSKQNSAGCFPSIATGGTNSLAAGNLTIDATLVLNNKVGILIWGRAASETPFHGGVLCVAAPFKRTPVQTSGGSASGVDCTGSFSFALDTAYAASKALVAGDVLHAQYWSRDAQSQGGASLTDGVQVLLCP